MKRVPSIDLEPFDNEKEGIIQKYGKIAMKKVGKHLKYLPY
jgi:hypothetical protein